MRPESLQIFNQSDEILPAEMVFLPRSPLPQEPMVNDELSLADDTIDSLEVRATKLTSILEHIQGYEHGGINE